MANAPDHCSRRNVGKCCNCRTQRLSYEGRSISGPLNIPKRTEPSFTQLLQGDPCVFIVCIRDHRKYHKKRSMDDGRERIIFPYEFATNPFVHAHARENNNVKSGINPLRDQRKRDFANPSLGTTLFSSKISAVASEIIHHYQLSSFLLHVTIRQSVLIR